VCQKRESRSAVEAQGNLGTLGAWGGLGAVKGGTENSSQSRPFLPPFHSYRDLCGKNPLVLFSDEFCVDQVLLEKQ
jgi:hypothetical protein